MGEKVEAFHKSNEYQPGLIVAVNREANLYDVSFDDGSELMDLAPHFIRKVSPPAPLLGHGHHHRSHSHHHHDHHKKSSKPHDKSSSDPSSTSTSRIHYKPGDQVEALREGNKIWRFAVIAKTHHDHTYDVIYSDRVRENRLGYDLIRPLFEKTANTEDSAENDKANKKVDFPADDKNDIKPQQTQRQASKSKEHESVDHIDENVGLKVGLEVEARYHGGELYYPGTVTKVSNRNQTCDIRYEDGDRETFVPMDYIRPRSEDHSRGKSRAKKNDNINSGDNNKNGSDQRGKLTRPFQAIFSLCLASIYCICALYCVRKLAMVGKVLTVSSFNVTNKVHSSASNSCTTCSVLCTCSFALNSAIVPVKLTLILLPLLNRHRQSAVIRWPCLCQRHGD